MGFNLDQFITISFTLFAVIDILGSIPLLISLKDKMGGIRPLQATLVSGALMILFLLIGEQFLHILTLDIHSFAVGGSIVMFLLSLEMLSGMEIFKGDADVRSGTVVPIAFPIIAGSGTLTTVMSLKANYEERYIFFGILVNLIFVYLVLHSLKWLERVLGKAGHYCYKKIFWSDLACNSGENI